MYYLIKPDGTSIFEQGYCYDFIMHCLFNLIDNPDPALRNCLVVYIDTAGRLALSSNSILLLDEVSTVTQKVAFK